MKLLKFLCYQQTFKINAYFSFRCHLFLQLIALGFISFFLFLGFWQLDRAALKETMQLDYLSMTQEAKEVISLNHWLDKYEVKGLTKLRNYTLVEVRGRYDFSRQILRDNRIHQNQVGYFVFTPFFIENSDFIILVNRGWIAKNQFNFVMDEILPKKTNTNETIKIKGYIYKSLDRFELGKYSFDHWPAIMQNLNYLQLKEQFKQPFIETSLRLHPEQENGLMRKWVFTTSTSKEKHQAYALQWFSFAMITFFILLYKSLIFSKF